MAIEFKAWVLGPYLGFLHCFVCDRNQSQCPAFRDYYVALATISYTLVATQQRERLSLSVSLGGR